MPAPALAASDYELLFSVLPAPCAVLDAQGTVLALNQAMAVLLPNAANLTGQPVEALRKTALATGAVLPGTRSCVAGLAEALAGKLQVLQPRPPAGRVASPARRFWQVTLQPVHGASADPDSVSKPRYVLLHLLDVSERVQAVAASAQQQQLVTLTEDLPQLLWTANAKGLVNYANQSWYEYTGLSPIATYGHGWLSAIHPHDRESVTSQWQHCLSTGTHWESTFRLCQGQSGQYRWHLARALPQRQASSGEPQWLGSFTDIHAQHEEARRTQQRRHHDSRLLAQLDQLPLHLVLMRGPRHEVSYVSASARDFLGPNAVGHEAASLNPPPPPDSLAAFDEVYRTGETRPLGRVPATPLAAPANALPQYIDATALPLRAPDGSVEGVLMAGIDVTDRLSFEKQMAEVTAESQRQLQTKEAQQRRILDQLPTYIATYEGPELRLSYLSPNHAELLGGPRAEVGQTLREAAPELAEQGLEALLRRVYETGQPHLAFEQELEFAMPGTGQRQRRFLNFGYYPLYGDEGQPTGILAFAHDVTSQVQAHRQAEALQAEARTADLRLRHMTESLPNHTFIIDQTGSLLYLSPQWYAFTGLTPADDVVGRWPELVHPDDRPHVQAQYNAALAAGLPWRYELRMRRHDGQYCWFVSVGIPEPEADAQASGRLRQWFASNLDVQAFKETQLQLEQKDQQLSQILGLMPVSVATLVGPDHRFSYFNARYNELAGQRACLGQPLAACLPELVSQGFVALLDNVYRTGQTYSAQEAPVLLTSADDPAGVHELFVSFTFQALRDGAGTIYGVMSVAVDMTAQVQARQRTAELQEQVQRRDSRIRLMTESLPLISYISAADGTRTEYLSPQWFDYTGTDPARVDYLSEWARAIHPDDLPGLVESFGPAIQAQRPWMGELRLRRHDGQYRWHLTRSVPEVDAATGELLRWYGSTTDIHELREARYQLEEKDRQLSQILNQSPALIATLEGPEHRYAFTNSRYDALVGQRARLGSPVAECLPEVAEQGFLKLLDQVYRSGEPFVGREISIALLDPATQQRQVSYLDFTYQPLRSNDGETTGVLAFMVDVTEQVLARQHAAELQAGFRWRDEQLRTLTRTVPVFIFSYSTAGQLTYLNPYFYEYTGLDPKGPLEQVWASVHPEDALPAGVRFQQSLAEGSAWEALYRIRRADGEYRWCQTKVQPSLGTDGQVDGYSGATVEIHEQYELTSQLARREEEFRFLAESIPQLVWTVEADGKVAFVNQRWVDYTGQDLAQTQDLGWGDVLFPEDRDYTVARFTESLASGQPFGIENRMRNRADGQYRWFLHRGVPLFNEQGELLRWFGTSTDVHEQHGLQERLRESEAQFRVLANAIPQLAWMTDQTGFITWFNQGWYDYTGTTPEEVHGWGWEKVHHIDHVGHVVASWKQCLESGIPWEMTSPLRKHTGEYEWFLTRAIPIRDDSGRIIRWFGTNTNVHAMRELQLRLEQQNAALLRTNQDLDNFVYTASHDLKQPINNMAGIFEELTRTAYFRDPDAIKLITYFERALKQIYGTIADLSAIVQAQRQQGEVEAVEVPLAALTAEVINSVHDQVKQLGATFELDFDTFPNLRMVRPNLQSLLYNLISNSLKYAVPGRPPHIQIACRPDAATGRPVLTVTDNGLGIDMERFGPQLFQLFRRFHTHVEGSGMGLYLVNRMVQNHGGRLEVESTVGEGSTFRLFL
ncbi:hypothetical protein GCM10023185_38950 [Hymenobacter saemangeumensis]|uniref:histidine kinase n=1 Tax=Hymenobacter saemangeumensis TaxID=1084522 RepID=A0ABP8IS47_9BACT